MLKCIEDRLLDETVLRTIERLHQGEIVDVKRHVRLEGLECDAVATLKLQRVKRTIGFELKINDLAKVVEQAFARRHLFDYMYAVCQIEFPLYDILNWLNSLNLLKLIFDEGLGLIVLNPILVVSKAKWNKNRPNLTLEELLKSGNS